ncbi:MAG: electron transfer flavoprotein subunit beta/FixA family protein [Planctomycetota bacterium]
MDYHCIVCVKQVPDTAHVTADAMKADGTVNRGALPAIMNPDDLHALEGALAVREQHGGSVTAITMGPLGAAEVLRQCLYRGADRAVLINDRRAAASDTLATSYILAQAVRKIGTYDLVFCGRQAIDGDTAQVGPQLAEKLGLVQITYLERFLELSDRLARVRRNVGNGWEVLEARLPLLVTTLDTANEPRPPAARRVMQYKRAWTPAEVERHNAKELIGGPRAGKPLIEQWDLDDIDADLQWCGLSGSPTKVHRVQSIVLTKSGYKEVKPTEQDIRDMVHELIVDHTLG